MHIDNLYKNIDIMNFKECYALEKIHGTSAHIAWKDGQIRFFSGGETHAKFVKLFNEEDLIKLFTEHFEDLDVVLFGEAYGGKQQGMSDTYGKELKFVAFDVKIGLTWLDVINAEDVTKKMNLEFVDYVKIPTLLGDIDFQRDRPSTQAERNGVEGFKLREGVVLRPLTELIKSNGKRIIVKHKRDEFKETRTKREVDPEKLKLLEEANAIATEWVTPMRLSHILDKLDSPLIIEETPKVIKAMIEDVYREAKGEILQSKGAKTAIGKETAKMYKLKISKLK